MICLKHKISNKRIGGTKQIFIELTHQFDSFGYVLPGLKIILSFKLSN